MSHVEPDEREVCMCFHVPLNKIVKFVRLHDPKVPSQLSECYGAGTGCGWCIPFLTRIYEQVKAGEEPSIRMSAEEYRQRRAAYRSQLEGTGPSGDEEVQKDPGE